MAAQQKNDQLELALEWWKAMLDTPIFALRRYKSKRPQTLLFPDGYWDPDQQTEAVGFLAFTPQGVVHSGAEITENECKRQRS